MLTGAEGVTHPSRTTWSCRVKAARPAGTSSWDMDVNMVSLDDPACTPPHKNSTGVTLTASVRRDNQLAR